MLEEIFGFRFELQADGSSALERVLARIVDDAKSGRIRFPNVLLIVVVFGGDDHFVGDQEGGVESDPELADHVVHVLSSLGVLHFAQELGRSGFGDRAQVVDQVLLRHAHARVGYVQHVVLFVGFYADVHLVGGVKYVLVSQGE